MAREIENVTTLKDEGYEYYGTQIVTVHDTETGQRITEHVEFSPSKSPGEALAEAVQRANDKF